jgi:GNAT superfamily N-acetyltransferase
VVVTIRRATPRDAEAIVELWWRSALATRDCVSAEETAALRPEVAALDLAARRTWLACTGAGLPAGLFTARGVKVDALYVHPPWIRSGIGTRLVAHAARSHGRLRVDVNERNEPARAGHHACGVVVIGRSPTDDAGRR